MKKLFFVFFVFLSGQIFACRCSYESLNKKVLNSDFIAKVEILKITTNEKNSNIRDLKINILELFKGDETQKLKIFWSENPSCSYTANENSTWLIFANKLTDNTLIFSRCSGSKDLNSWHDPNTEPIHFEIEVLKYIKNNNIKIGQSNRLHIAIPFKYRENIDKLVTDKKKYCSLYELTINNNLKVKSIRSMRGNKSEAIESTLIKGTHEYFKKYNIPKIKKEGKILVRLSYIPYGKYDKLIFDSFDY